MAEMYRAWAKGHPPPAYSANPTYIPPLAQPQDPPTVNSSPTFPTYQQCYGTTSQTPPPPPPKQVAYPPPPITPVFVAPPPAALHRSSSEPLFQTHDNHYYPPEPTFKAPEPCSYTPHLDLSVETEKPPKNPECPVTSMVQVAQALEPTYFGHLVSAVGKSFNEVVKMGSMVEEGLKSNKIMSYSTIKATSQAIQNGTGGVLGKKKK
ncbi:PREDICTED: extensin-like [Nicotiana attenuata]|uniref:extensin-like n=1 Tax=Nicotiana attenuata TaxID=49451 RepID=UPI000905C903|nr:PREDICTED: extensin-like [Nicotiana attenuata]